MSGTGWPRIKVLLDPYGRGVAVPDHYGRAAAGAAGDNTATAMKSVVVDPSAYDWEGDAPLRRPSVQTIVYEMHVRRFTRHPSSGVGERTRGTFAGLIEKIPRLRNRQVKNFLTATLLSLGMPMILMGDEARRTQSGNNNAYCQDNELSWFDWTLIEQHADVHRFVALLNERRLLRDAEHERLRVTLDELIRRAHKAWHGVKLGQPDWGEHSHSVAFEAELRREGLRVYLIMNAYSEPLEFKLPPVDDGTSSWRRWIDTALESPEEIVPWETAPPLSVHNYRAAPHSVVVLIDEVRRGHIPG